MNGARLALLTVLTLIGQVALVPRIAISGIQPDLTVLLVVLAGLRGGPITGTLVGFFLGLLQDLLVPQTLGMNALAKAVVGWQVGKISRQLALEGPPLYLGLVAAAVLVHDFIYLLCFTHLDLGRFFVMFFTNAIPTAIYTGIVASLMAVLVVVLQQGSLGRTGGGRRG
jgi:rod shape-determining protein MreD